MAPSEWQATQFLARIGATSFSYEIFAWAALSRFGKGSFAVVMSMCDAVTGLPAFSASIAAFSFAPVGPE